MIDRACVAAIRIQRHSHADSKPGDLTQRVTIPAVTKAVFRDDTVQSGKNVLTFQRALLPPTTKYFTILYRKDSTRSYISFLSNLWQPFLIWTKKIIRCLAFDAHDRLNTICWNVGTLLPDYTASDPRRQQHLQLPLWKPLISHYQSVLHKTHSSKWGNEPLGCVKWGEFLD